MSADVVPTNCVDNASCAFRPGKCSIMNISPLGYKANYICGYSTGTHTYMCNPGCCPGGVAEGFCPNTVQPPPTCSDVNSCDAAYSSKPCKPHLLDDGRYACGYVESASTPDYGIVDMFYFCNPGCSSCKGTGAVGPCPGQRTDFQKVSYNNERPTDNPWRPVPATIVQAPFVTKLFIALIVLLVALVIAGTLALL